MDIDGREEWGFNRKGVNSGVEANSGERLNRKVVNSGEANSGEVNK